MDANMEISAIVATRIFIISPAKKRARYHFVFDFHFFPCYEWANVPAGENPE